MDNSKQEKKPCDKAQRLLDGYTRKELRDKGLEIVIDITLDLDKKNLALSKLYEHSQMEVQRLRNRVRELENAQKPQFKYQGYDKSKGWIFKLCFILERNGQKMTFKQLKEAFLILEPDLKDRWINVDNYISQILHSAAVRGAIEKAKSVRERGFYYTLPAGS